MDILGVTIRDDLHAVDHVDKLILACTHSLYALRVLRAQGLHDQALHVVTEATTMARLFYASPAWWGLTSAKDRD